MRALRRSLTCLLLAAPLAGCSTIGSVTDTSCKSFKPITGSSQDTTITKRQVVAHNKVFDTICPAKT